MQVYVVFDYKPGVPVFGVVLLPEAETITPLGEDGRSDGARLDKPMKLEWLNSPNIREILCREQFIGRIEYVIKER
jgi:hypothetical protein